MILANNAYFPEPGSPLNKLTIKIIFNKVDISI
jgi:hypothetical protein